MFSDYFASIPIIATKRLCLRQFTIEDIPAYRKEFESEHIQKYLGGVLLLKNNEEDAQNWIRNINDRLLKRKLVLTWHIVNHQEQSIGRVDLGGFRQRKVAEISYYIWKASWGNGYGTEAVEAVIRFGFHHLELERISATIHIENLGSQKLIEKVGLRKEGVLRNYPLGKSLQDVYMYSIIREEYGCPKV